MQIELLLHCNHTLIVQLERHCPKMRFETISQVTATFLTIFVHRAITTSTQAWQNTTRESDTSVQKKKKPRFTIYVRSAKPLICALARPAACKAGLPFSIQHTEVQTIVHITLALCSDCFTRIIVCALLIIRVPEYHCATPLIQNLAAENTILLKTISIVI